MCLGGFKMRLIWAVSWPTRPAGFYTFLIRFSHGGGEAGKQGRTTGCGFVPKYYNNQVGIHQVLDKGPLHFHRTP